MKIRIISVGHKMPEWVENACQEYIKRMPREASVEIVEIKPDKRAAGKTSSTVQEAEAKRILDACGKDYVIALDEKGNEVTTLQLSSRMVNWLAGGRDVSLIIGGADGLHPDIKKKADWLWSLSKLTLPHGMVRVVLAEQLYRAWTVINHHPYHRE
jgi:23S rRNA (pseudouridine1915-N3)-methyltransferase